MMMSKKKKRLHVSKLEPIARDATRNALSKALADGKEWLTVEQLRHITLGTFITDDICVFDLYIAADKPSDGRIISRAIVDRYTGNLIKAVDVFLPPVLESELPE
ncbi:hypothetical protein PL246_23465 [Salmonella enterica]|uniref:hypothetical protein n=1 Tax=Salmonella enterica TaxID=28901 RepID=UPI0018D17736|nr:hypothetical protein [Salmonella enterica]EHO5066531.1 hypothetical protein [Salmonella enterica]EHO5107763.1 hypothetical protein [Salmonella enterica]EHO5923801.1 hypothetical protein [Salmonella enterica]MBH0368976.1 hypothetical protein [Salmonella enterica]MBH0487722.1 hypothetical protein [Salmonella enterica]